MITYAEAPHLEEFIANIDIQEIFTPEQGSHINLELQFGANQT